MIFTSLVFLIFFAVVYAAYLGTQRHLRLQNALLLCASYVFYGYWEWRFLLLIVGSTLVDYWVARRLNGTDDSRRRKRLVALSVVVNLTVLGFFKYFNFFISSTKTALELAGWTSDLSTLDIILPVGISFYTFQTMSYTIDVYRRRMKPANSLLEFAVFVAFFPQLVAGPIERAQTFLPQIQKPRTITAEGVNAGLFLILWGFFKKAVIADNVAVVANTIFDDVGGYEGLDLLAGVLAFTIQIYGDFSGYSDIARGLAKLMGFELMLNFKLPYFALSPAEFWQRWHISLSSWLRDYLYIPLGGNRGGTVLTYRNLCLTMLLGGLWHGAAWHFVLWGAFHGTILVVYRLVPSPGRPLPGWTVVPRWAVMFGLTMVGWVIFRAASLQDIGTLLGGLGLQSSSVTAGLYADLLFFSWPLIVMQVFQHKTRNLLCVTRLPQPVLWVLYGLMLLWLLVFGMSHNTEFIYFQF